jgi:hypothetical protein
MFGIFPSKHAYVEYPLTLDVRAIIRVVPYVLQVRAERRPV